MFLSLGLGLLTLLYPEMLYASADITTDVPKIEIGVDVSGKAVEIPLVGAGTWQYNDTIAYRSVCKAFDAGYTFVDTAYGYGNQKGVGKAIKDCWRGLRSELFVMTKIPGGLTAEQVHAAHIQNLWDLELEYVDHLMLHFPSDWSITIPDKASPERRQESWLALEEIYYSGKARSIGVSHYCPKHLDDILEVATVNPSVNQVEYHVGSRDVDGVIEKCNEAGITYMSFSPLCGPCKIDDPMTESLVHGSIVTEIGEKYGVSGSQVSLRFIVQQALDGTRKIGPVIPKSDNMDHIKANMDIFSFELSEEDMEALKSLSSPAAEGGDCDVP